MHIDSFSGAAAELKRGHRNSEDVLAALAKNPRISTWDMSELPWLRSAIDDLKRRGLIIAEREEPYPWNKYSLTDDGMAMLTSND